ncbi:hypothetical protein K144313037_17530 [Clostridium tetani]|uniref:DNA-directed RNA polymerase subunit alpha C-terminal domain-containing protein n=1 Tax=Clostridium tetani TaxID=1513 RepID=UPI000D20468C|nr:DNA-directed RNA polymerase subunit alpha C-terminal domain-containing protein [Clostridium tetani]AVP55276.1 RNA polymerase subunit sigma [Clostridium tetani]BDR70341.1 hypothetical protein K144313037_17530 [Clostridium tetani]BDR84415.1 hypothetical protein K254310026_18260 [Clostridium tetani]
MTNVKNDTSIEVLNLSLRSYNGLRNADIFTVRELLLTPREQIENIRGLGAKSIKEILLKIKTLGEFYVNDYIKSDIKDNANNIQKSFIGTDGLKYVDIPIEELNLSCRAFNCLKRNGIKYYSQLIDKTDEELISTKNIGVTTLTEINELKSEIILNKFSEQYDNQQQNNTKEFDSETLNFIAKVGNLLNCNVAKLIIYVTDLYFDNSNEDKNIAINDEKLTENEILRLMYKTEYAKEKWIKYVLKLIKKETYGFEEEDLFDNIPDLLKNREIFDEVLSKLIITKQIDLLYDDRFVAVYEELRVGAQKCLKDREYEILMHRIMGKTLEETGVIYEITRERVRQIESKAIKTLNNMRAKFKEDIYLDTYRRYLITTEDFKLAFGEEETYNYLVLRYGNSVKKYESSKKPLNEILKDHEIPIPFRRAFEKAIYKNHIKIGNDRVLCTREGIGNYIIKNYAINDLKFQEFKEIYFMILNDLNKLEDPQLSLLDRGYENRLMASMNVLWKYGRQFRYYDINSYDFTELLNTIDLNQYLDVEYSTLKFFRLYPELMKNYDIQDEYELHNLLKKICDPVDYPKIKFNRMPNIEFGTADRDEQINELLFMLAPISNQDFAKQYEKYYGVSAETVLANYVESIDKYFYKGYYNIDFPEFPKLIEERLKELLIDDIYTLPMVKQIFNNEFPQSDKDILNPLSLKSLGFKIYENYIVKDKYDSASDYFFQLLTKNDITDIGEIHSKFREIIIFSVQLYKLKGDYEIIEFMPNRMVNFRKLKEVGISKEILKQYCKDVLSFVGEGKYFTIYSLKKGGFIHDLDELGFEDWFYTSILIEDKENISYRRIGGNKIMISGKYDFTFGEFLENIVYSQENMFIYIYDLYDILKQDYNINIDIYKLISIINSTSMHYDSISELVFADYDTYYEVI